MAYFTLQLVTCIIIILILLISWRCMSDSKYSKQEHKLKAWNRMLNAYKDVDLDEEDNKLLKLTFSNTLRNSRIKSMPCKIYHEKSRKQVRFSKIINVEQKQ